MAIEAGATKPFSEPTPRSRGGTPAWRCSSTVVRQVRQRPGPRAHHPELVPGRGRHVERAAVVACNAVAFAEVGLCHPAIFDTVEQLGRDATACNVDAALCLVPCSK